MLYSLERYTGSVPQVCLRWSRLTTLGNLAVLAKSIAKYNVIGKSLGKVHTHC